MIRLVGACSSNYELSTDLLVQCIVFVHNLMNIYGNLIKININILICVFVYVICLHSMTMGKEQRRVL